MTIERQSFHAMSPRIDLEASEDLDEVARFRCSMFGGMPDDEMKVIARSMRGGKVFVVRRRGTIIASLILTTRKP